MDMSQQGLMTEGFTGGRTQHHNNIHRFRHQHRIVDFGSDPRFLETIARELQWDARDEEKDLERVRRGVRHVVRTRNRANLVVFLQEVDRVMREHGLDSKFSRAVGHILHAVRDFRFQEALSSVIPELSQVS
ncbi:hypothetical protein KW797_03605 [Candidatus Parcubacteria bacterium]|nr:hypothetical protein [Candidatus Parcubacteria bacterium]